MAFARQWWRRAFAAAKDRRSLYLARVAVMRPLGSAGGARRSPELEAAVIRAMSHDDRSVDYKNAERVFAWARLSPSFLLPLMWALARRAARTRCWAVALKALMIAHGLLLLSDLAPPAARLGRIPFDLADFGDRSSSPSKSAGLSAFVRAYFRFLDFRSLFATQDIGNNNEDSDDDVDDNDHDACLNRIAKLHFVLELLMQIRPYGNGMEQGLVLEAMNCVVIEIFAVYSQICTGIAWFLAGILGPGETAAAARQRRGAAGMKVLRQATEQSAQLSAYFELCRVLGVLKAAKFPAVERVLEDDILVFQKLLMSNSKDSAMVAAAALVEEEEKKALGVARD